jgi:protein-S-isoprenylcysteine O-methyltransferase Ste14
MNVLGSGMTIMTADQKVASKSALGRYQWWRKLLLAIVGLGLLALCSLVGARWQHLGGHAVIEGVGLALIAVGILGRLWCTLYIGERKAAMIVTSGPYSISRNPLYLFSSVAVAGLGAQTGTITLAVVFFTLSVVAFHIVIAREEGFLSANFGEPYAAYCKGTPRFWPNPSLHSCPGTVEAHPKRLLMTLLDGLMFLLVIPIMELVEHLQFAGIIKPLILLY